MKILFTSLLSLVSHSVIAHDGSIFAAEHLDNLGLALMALGIFFASIAVAMERFSRFGKKDKATRKHRFEWVQELVPTLKRKTYVNQEL